MGRALVAVAVSAFVAIALATAALAADQRITVCGAVASYTPPTATANGSIVVGTQTLVLAAGSSVSSVNPPIRPGSNGCFTGTRQDDGSFVDYGVTPLPASYCGTVSTFTPATATAAGSITLGTNATVRLIIPAGTTVAATVGGSGQCYSIGIANSGDAVITGNAGAPQVGVAGPSNAPVTAGNLPSSSTDVAPTPLLALAALLVALVAIAALRMRRASSE